MFRSIRCSLRDLLGSDYLESVIAANAALGCLTAREAEEAADEKVEFYSARAQERNDGWLGRVGEPLLPPMARTSEGAGTTAYREAANTKAAPLTGFGCYRVGEDGRLYLLGKSEHYHASLGHRFDGYRLIDLARKLGILNATHNNTRGYITRRLEKRLVQAANGLRPDQEQETLAVLRSRQPKVLNRVINLETGSLAVEAGVKMMLARFYRLDGTFAQPKYAGKTPVFLVMGDQNGGGEANYHGTTVLTQTFRGLWPELRDAAQEAGLYKVVPVAINDPDDFEEKIRRYNTGNYKTAGFLHEIILMNYGGVRLQPEYLKRAYALCAACDTPTLVDEIQSCMWYKGMFLFRLYGLQPDFAVVGKGFPGGEYPASKILTTFEMDTLNQFGALVTNGQEELASLSYLITMAFMEANGDVVMELGGHFERSLRRLQAERPEALRKVEGQGHLIALHFHTVEQAAAFAQKLNRACIDASAQLYKPHCPPAVLLKPPVIATRATLDYLAAKIRELL
ncbi:MAG TPA: aminotransferase class III-fold pyridoxal phosphate-dependent enzyme [Firmicutes bacterium]|nr:aminotransferase class III-fold pyridoxal phosphate-dependent enzyme [Bacillota bacterium]